MLVGDKLQTYVPKESHNNASFYQFIDGYVFRFQLRTIIKPFTSVDTGKFIHCIKMEISPFVLKMHCKCIKPLKCVLSMKGRQQWNACV